MPRPIRPREIESLPNVSWFKPAGVPLRDLEEVVLTLDEMEAIRLADAEGLYQEQVAEQMKVSRPTVGRILSAAREKIAMALVEGKAIRIEGGEFFVRKGGAGKPCCTRGKGKGRGPGRRAKEDLS